MRGRWLRAVTVSFLTLAIAQLVHVFNMRGLRSGSIRNEVTGNPFVWGVMGLEPPGAAGWTLVLTLGALPLILGPLVRRSIARVEQRADGGGRAR